MISVESERREQLLFAAEVVATLIPIILGLRVMLGDDALHSVRMRLALVSERVCQRQAEGWAHLADASRKVYDQGRSVTV